MIVRCNYCKEEFDDTGYLEHHNKSGFEAMLLSHYENHQKELILSTNFTNILQGRI